MRRWGCPPLLAVIAASAVDDGLLMIGPEPSADAGNSLRPAARAGEKSGGVGAAGKGGFACRTRTRTITTPYNTKAGAAGSSRCACRTPSNAPASSWAGLSPNGEILLVVLLLRLTCCYVGPLFMWRASGARRVGSRGPASPIEGEN